MTEIQSTITKSSTISKPLSNMQVYDPTYFIKNCDTMRIAEQFTRCEFDLWKKVQPFELLKKAWCSEKLKHRAVNVRDLIERFNNISLWVASSILWSDKTKERSKILSRFIKIGKNLWELGNFSTLLAMVSGINVAAVRRLKQTFEGISSKSVTDLEFLDTNVSGMNRFQAIRESLKTRTPPVIPYLGIYLADLTFIEDGNSDFTDELINFRKSELLYGVIADIQQYQQTDYTIGFDPELMNLIQDLPFNSENELIKLSYKREPKTV